MQTHRLANCCVPGASLPARLRVASELTWIYGMAERPHIDELSRTGQPQLTSTEIVILVAEDEPVVRNLIQLMLVKEGYAVLTASDGQEALEIIDKFAAPIHLLLTDVRMPRMDGWTLAEHARKRCPDIKILVISGETATTILEKNPADAFLRKPFIPPTLLACIQRVLASGFKGVCEEIVAPGGERI